MRLKNRKGFTLAEMLVTVAIIAALAAVVIPTVGGALFKGDIGRVQSDLTSIRSGTEQFLADIRRYPGHVTDLTTAITATDTDLNATATPAAYGATLVQRWKGPYMNNAAGATGAAGTIQASFIRSDCTTALTTTVTTPCLTVIITGISAADAAKIDRGMDDGVTTTGLLRFVTGSPDTVKYLALPIQ